MWIRIVLLAFVIFVAVGAFWIALRPPANSIEVDIVSGRAQTISKVIFVRICDRKASPFNWLVAKLAWTELAPENALHSYNWRIGPGSPHTSRILSWRGEREGVYMLVELPDGTRHVKELSPDAIKWRSFSWVAQGGLTIDYDALPTVVREDVDFTEAQAALDQEAP